MALALDGSKILGGSFSGGCHANLNNMKNEITTANNKVSALAVMASRLNVDPSKLHGTLKATVFKNASDEELLALVVVANEYRLNPLTKEIYAFPAKGGGIVPVVSVDGWISMVNDHPAMDGMEFDDHHDEGKLVAVTCRIFRKDRQRPIEVTEYLSECKRQTDAWKMEHRMLRHKALIQCARYAFGFSGVTDEDEAADTPAMRDVTPPPAKQTRRELPPVNPFIAPPVDEPREIDSEAERDAPTEQRDTDGNFLF